MNAKELKKLQKRFCMNAMSFPHTEKNLYAVGLSKNGWAELCADCLENWDKDTKASA